MHVLVNVPLPKYDLSVADQYRSMVSELFLRSGRIPSGSYYFLRTWDQRTLGECVQMSLELRDVDSREVVEAVREAVRSKGYEPDVREMPSADVPSPLWNAGFGGVSFDSVSKELYRDASPLMAEFAEEARESVADAYRLALRLMAEHDRATLVDSEQREVGTLDFADLLSARFLSFRSHYEGMAARVKDRASFEGRYAEYYDRFGSYARELVASCTDPEAPSGGGRAMGVWADNVSASTKPLRDGVREGRIVNTSLTLDDLNRDREVPLAPTGFHAFGQDSEAFQYLMNSDPDFMAFRIQAGFLYSCLHTIGFSLPERYLFCYILARANEDVAGKSATELQVNLRSVAEKMYSRAVRPQEKG